MGQMLGRYSVVVVTRWRKDTTPTPPMAGKKRLAMRGVMMTMYNTMMVAVVQA